MGMGRAPEQVSAIVGYAGGKAQGNTFSWLAPCILSGMPVHAPSTYGCVMQGRRARCATIMDPEIPSMSGWGMQRWCNCSWTLAKRVRSSADLQTCDVLCRLALGMLCEGF